MQSKCFKSIWSLAKIYKTLYRFSPFFGFKRNFNDKFSTYLSSLHIFCCIILHRFLFVVFLSHLSLLHLHVLFQLLSLGFVTRKKLLLALRCDGDGGGCVTQTKRRRRGSDWDKLGKLADIAGIRQRSSRWQIVSFPILLFGTFIYNIFSCFISDLVTH